MSQVKLTLRPPPNVDFVHGYPGIPPAAPDRPQATVKGAIEVRVLPQNVKAKWVRVELRKVETLPGGGQSNTFYDLIGPSPLTLWQAEEEWSLLTSTDFPFQIRIPESIPPSIALENRAGIKYELLASVCTQGKKSWFRRRKANVESTSAPIIIDKHELHSTWPVYCQPETRQVSQDGVTLTVDRDHTCHGPGDRITVVATLKSESLHTIILRGFELALKESTIFRAGPYTSGTGSKKSNPQVRVATICENRIPINSELYGGAKHRADLSCVLSPSHTTTTLNAARHIDITYVLSVKALMGTGTFTTLTMDLPIMISNWQSVVSQEAVRRIGPVPSLSLMPAGASSVDQSTSVPTPQTYGGRPSQPETTTPRLNNTYGANGYAAGSGRPDEFGGYGASKINSYGSKPSASQNQPPARRPSVEEGGRERRFTVTNTVPGELPPAATNPSRRKPSVDARVPPSPAPSPPRQYLTAEQEKERLYRTAKEQAERAQALASRSSPPPEAARISPPRPSGSSKYMNAEEEKAALYNRAQAAVQKAQAQGYVSPQEEIASPTPRPATAGGSTQARSSPPSNSRHLTAEQEKAQLRRYQEAVQAVNRTVGAEMVLPPDDVGVEPVQGLGGPVAYESLYPPGPSSPPPFEAAAASGSSRQMPKDAFTQLQEKQRLQRELEARDTAERARMGSANGINGTSGGPPPASDSPPPFSSAGGSSFNPEGLSEKELLRRKFAQEDAQVSAGNTSPPPPTGQASTSPRPTPVPPVAAGSARPLTAAEEKAILKAKYESENQVNKGTTTPPKPTVNGHNHVNGAVSPPSRGSSQAALQPPPSTATPPPLAPKPPKAYIAETQEEDARVSKFAFESEAKRVEREEEEESLRRAGSPRLNGGFSPQNLYTHTPIAPPPLPPKPEGD